MNKTNANPNREVKNAGEKTPPAKMQRVETLVSKRSYGEYSSSNYGAHTQQINIGQLTLWFSYDTVIAFKDRFEPAVYSKNVWGVTTGKHLNWISHKSDRIPHDQFVSQLAEVLQKHELKVA